MHQYIRKIFVIACDFTSGIYLPKVNNRNARTRCEICLKLKTETPEQHQFSSLRCLYCKLYTHLTTCLVFVLVTLNMQLFVGQLRYVRDT